MQGHNAGRPAVPSLMRRRFRLLVLAPVFTVAIALVASYTLITPMYSASTTLWVIRSGVLMRYDDLRLNRDLARTYAEVAKTRALMEEVIAQLQLHAVSPGDLRRVLTVTPVRDTELLLFSVRDPDPVVAAQLSNAIAEAFRRQIRQYMQVENVVVIDRAIVPTSPVEPRPLWNGALALLLGVLLAAGLALLAEYQDTSIKSPDEVSRLFGVPVLGVIPYARTCPTGVITLQHPAAPASEAFYALRTGLRRREAERPLRSLLITSATPGEGKTTVAANLAVALARTGRQVCLVDANLRRPTLMNVFSMDCPVGLTDVLSDKQSMATAVCPTHVTGLSLLPGGEPVVSPAEAIDSEQMQTVVQEAVQRFDWVLFDSPSVLSAADALLLAARVDGVVLVAGIGAVARHQLAATLESLDAVQAPVLGVVVNRARQ